MGGICFRMVEVLSRFRTTAQQKKVVEGLKNGTVDIVIGTHRLLSKDVAFGDLGLLVIDEEHRFPKELVQGMAEIGLMGVAVPEEYGGAEMDNLGYVLAMEEIAVACASRAGSTSNWFPSGPTPRIRWSPVRRSSITRDTVPRSRFPGRRRRERASCWRRWWRRIRTVSSMRTTSA